MKGSPHPGFILGFGRAAVGNRGTVDFSQHDFKTSVMSAITLHRTDRAKTTGMTAA